MEEKLEQELMMQEELCRQGLANVFIQKEK